MSCYAEKQPYEDQTGDVIGLIYLFVCLAFFFTAHMAQPI